MALLDNTAHAMYAAAHGMTSQYHVNLMNSRIMASAAAASANNGNTVAGGAPVDLYTAAAHGGVTDSSSPNQPNGIIPNAHGGYSPLSTSSSSRHTSHSRLNLEADIRIGMGTPRSLHLHHNIDNTSTATQSPPPQSNTSSSTEPPNENLSSSLESNSSPNTSSNNNNSSRKRRYENHEVGMTMNLKLEPASSLSSTPNPSALASSLHHAFKPIFGSTPAGKIFRANIQFGSQILNFRRLKSYGAYR